MSNRPQLVANDFLLRGKYEHLRAALLGGENSDVLSTPLSLWTLPSDRHLPLTLMGLNVGQLLEMPYEQLAATPSVGRAKITGLLRLLGRASAAPAGAAAAKLVAATDSRHSEPDDPGEFSELQWAQACETVRRAGLQQEKLGHLALSLQEMPQAIWQTPLATYCDCSLAHIRGMKTHGAKRLRAVVAVFRRVQEMLGGLTPQDQLCVRLIPSAIYQVEGWIVATIHPQNGVAVTDVQDHLLGPLLSQLELDVGSSLSDLAASRVGFKREPESMMQLAVRRGVSRARVYQWLGHCAEAMQVRWPEGGPLTSELARHFTAVGNTDAARIAQDVCKLFYPDHGQTVGYGLPGEPVGHRAAASQQIASK